LGVCYLDGLIELFDKQGDGRWENHRIGEMGTEPTDIAFSADGKMVAVIGREGGLRLFGLHRDDGEAPMVEIETGNLPIGSVAFTRNGELLGLGVTNDAVRLWKIRCEHVRRDFEMDEPLRRAT
jgi:WD40 repeat protein